ncbi:MAG: hypothetical protein PWQ17_2695 [Anaerophaga sp.]|jgi:GNAT superfamily N-acetyltransferase|nr:hypothetical protein [Anaerophaga sp.]
MQVQYSRLESMDADLVRQIAEIHENAPSEWRDDHEVSDDRIQRRIEDLKTKITDSGFYLLMAQAPSGDLIGFHWLEIEEENKRRIGHIGSLWVAQKYRRQGIGKKMKEKAEVWAKKAGAEELRTEVYFANSRMIEYNKKLGYRPGQVIMTKDLR